MEKLVAAKSRFISPESSLFCTTRYGNVMASRGLLFHYLASTGKPLSVTDPNMTRFLASLDDSMPILAPLKKRNKEIFLFKITSFNSWD